MYINNHKKLNAQSAGGTCHTRTHTHRHTFTNTCQKACKALQQRQRQRQRRDVNVSVIRKGMLRQRHVFDVYMQSDWYACMCVCVCMCEGMPLYFYYVMPKRKIIQKRNVSSRRLSFDSLHFLYVSRHFFRPAVLFLIGNKRLLLLLLLFLIGAYWGRSQTDFTFVCLRVCVSTRANLNLC